MPDRKYEIEADEILPEGFEVGRPMIVDGNDPGALADLMLKQAAVLEMVGGTFSIVAVRRELLDANGNGTDLWVPERYIAKWGAFAPGASARRQAEAAQPQRVVPEPPLPEPPEPSEELTDAEMADHFPEEEAVADPEHASADPGVDPTPPGSSGFDMGSVLGNEQHEDVLAEITS